MNGDFYRSDIWRKVRASVINDRLKDGITICEYCDKPIVSAYDIIGHHKIALTPENIDDVNISLNPDNIMLVHHKCHNIIHNKLGYKNREVYLVYGSPLSGKTSYVDSVKQEGDLVVDMDNIWQCISGCNRYIKPNRLKAVAFSVRDNLLECVKYRRGKWQNAYIVGGYPLISQREALAKELGARVIYIDTNKEECIKRLEADLTRDTDEWKKYIDTWWENFSA